MTDRKPTVCLDFDGVVHAYTSAWTTATEIRDDIVPGAIEFIRAMQEHYVVAIHSSRSHVEGGVVAMQRWLVEQAMRLHPGFYPDYVSFIQFPLEKPPAMIYIDDRGFRFEGRWPSLETVRYLSTPWNRLAPPREWHARTALDPVPTNPDDPEVFSGMPVSGWRALLGAVAGDETQIYIARLMLEDIETQASIATRKDK